MHIPSYFIPIRANKTKSKKRAAVEFEKAEANTGTANQAVIIPVIDDDKREGEDRRKRHMKPLLDTRSGKDRRYDKRKMSIDIKA